MLQDLISRLFGKQVLIKVLGALGRRLLAALVTLLTAYEIDPEIIKQFATSSEALIAASVGVVASVLLSWFSKAREDKKDA